MKSVEGIAANPATLQQMRLLAADDIAAAANVGRYQLHTQTHTHMHTLLYTRRWHPPSLVRSRALSRRSGASESLVTPCVTSYTSVTRAIKKK